MTPASVSLRTHELCHTVDLDGQHREVCISFDMYLHLIHGISVLYLQYDRLVLR